MSKYAFAIETEPRLRDVRMLQHHLYEFNAEKTAFHDGNGLAILLRKPPPVLWNGRPRKDDHSPKEFEASQNH